MTLAELVLAYDAKYPATEKDEEMLVDAKTWAAFVRRARAEEAERPKPARPGTVKQQIVEAQRQTIEIMDRAFRGKPKN